MVEDPDPCLRFPVLQSSEARGGDHALPRAPVFGIGCSVFGSNQPNTEDRTPNTDYGLGRRGGRKRAPTPASPVPVLVLW